MLRGIGGEGVFLDRYRRESQATRTAAVNVAKLQSVLDALQVFLPGVFVVLVVWLGARSAVTGAISAGELVAFYGYSAFLMLPLRTATEFANKLIRGRVAAARVCRVMALEPDVVEPVLARRCPGARLRAVRRPLGAAGPPGPADRDRLRPARRLGPARRPPRPVRGRAGRRGLPRRRAPHLAAPRRRPRADHGLRHRRRPLRGTAGRPDRRARHRGRREGALHRVRRGHPRGAARGPRLRRHREGPLLLRRPAPAPGAGPRARRRPRGPRAGRADQRGGRPHRGADRRPPAGPPGGPHHGRHDGQPAAAGRRRRGGLPGRRPGRRGRHPHRAAVGRRGLPPGRRTRRGGGRYERHDPTARSPTAGPCAATSARSRTGTPASCGPRWASTCWPRSPRSPRRACSAASSSRWRTARPARTSTRSSCGWRSSWCCSRC